MDAAVSTSDLLSSQSPATTTYGVFYMTSLIIVVFWAMLSLQTFWYFASYEHDKKSLKFLVVFLWVIITTQTYIIVYGTWVNIIQNFGDFNFVLHVVPTYATELIFNVSVELFFDVYELTLVYLLHATATVTVQAFFVFRLCRLSGGKWWIPVAWAPLAVFQIVSAFLIVIDTAGGLINVQWGPLIKDLGIAYLVVSLFIDIAIAVYLLKLLHQHKEQISVQSTLRMIQRLMLLAVINMVWSTIFAICDLVLFLALNGKIFYFLFDMSIGALYCNTLLANLNMRASIADRKSTVDMDLTTSNPVAPRPIALALKNGEAKGSAQSDSRRSSELPA